LTETQIACRTLWENTEEETRFNETGEKVGALDAVRQLYGQHIELAMKSLPDRVQAHAKLALTKLITSGGTRNIVSKDDLFRALANDGLSKRDAKNTMDLLSKKTKLVYLQARGGTPFYEIASESLIPWIKKQDAIFQEEKRRANENPERNVLAQLESADADELSQFLRRPSADEERLLEMYFEAERYQRLRSLALGARRRAVAKGNVVVLHGIMGGGLTVFPTNENSQFIWLNFPRIATGAVGWLRMTGEFESQFDVRAIGISKKWYSEQLLGLLADGWNVQAFSYDWRQDLAWTADTLREQIDRWFGPDAPVNLVAHSMGGLVSRTYILRHAQRWGKEGRLIMLGTPNHGSFAIPQMITGAYDNGS
jgi:pimeloyl-ACP methyl ester carboxylesterase